MSQMATTSTLCTLYLKLMLQILCESCWFVGIWMVQGCEGVGDISGIRGVQRDLYVLRFKTRLTQELRPKVQVCYWYNLSTATLCYKESVALLTK